MTELSQGRQIPSEVIKDLEEQIKAKLPYLVGWRAIGSNRSIN